MSPYKKSSRAGWSLFLQIGCGNSLLASENRGPPQDDITVDMFVQEMAAVKQALGLQEHHMLGHGALFCLASLTWLPGRCMNACSRPETSEACRGRSECLGGLLSSCYVNYHVGAIPRWVSMKAVNTSRAAGAIQQQSSY